MAKVKVSYQGSLAAPPPSEPPRREDITPGLYYAMVTGLPKPGFTNSTPKLNKITVTFQILYEVLSDGTKGEKFKGRQVWQDYILDPSTGPDADFNAQRFYDLKMMLLATETPHDDEGFDPDEIGKNNGLVKIKIKNRSSTRVENGVQSTRVFTNIESIDTGKEISADAIV